MSDKKLIIPKGDGTLEMAAASLKIHYEHNTWLSNDDFREKLIEEYPDFEGKNTAFLLHKGRTARYFGLIQYLYKNHGNIKGRQGRITIEGKRFYEAYVAGNDVALIDTVMHCINKYTFGRNNDGVEGDSNVEMPAVFLKACLDLDYISKTESIAILYYMHDEQKSYEDAIARISELRENNQEASEDIPTGQGYANRYGDNKAAQLMREIGIFVANTAEYKLSNLVKNNYTDFIQNLKVTDYGELEEDIEEEVVEKNEEEKQEIETLLMKSQWKQKIYFGPPGIGKSFNVSKEIREDQINLGLIEEDSASYDSEYVYRTTIYPEYSYYDFIGNIMPVVKGENITYDFKPGVFTLALHKALSVEEYNIPVYLVIEEISRGNIASIFGDIFQLLDRKSNGESEYEIDNDIIAQYLVDKDLKCYKELSDHDKKEIYLPTNLNILGTVNTSDQNVFVMDTAFKRRFEFEYIDLDPVMNKETGRYLNEYEFVFGDFKFRWNDFYIKLNEYIVAELELPEDKQIGQFFIKFDKETDEENYKQIQNKLLQYLWEDIHHVNMTDNRLFKREYKSFSALYKDFGNRINVFDPRFIEKLQKTEMEKDDANEEWDKDSDQSSEI